MRADALPTAGAAAAASERGAMSVRKTGLSRQSLAAAAGGTRRRDGQRCPPQWTRAAFSDLRRHQSPWHVRIALYCLHFRYKIAVSIYCRTPRRLLRFSQSKRHVFSAMMLCSAQVHRAAIQWPASRALPRRSVRRGRPRCATRRPAAAARPARRDATPAAGTPADRTRAARPHTFPVMRFTPASANVLNRSVRGPIS